MEQRLIIGFVGLGAIGSGVARNLLRAGHDVVGFDLASERSSELAAAAAGRRHRQGWRRRTRTT